MSTADLIAQARAAMHETAAQIRALPDHELVALVMSGELAVRTCRSCGCTNDDCRACIEKTGAPCTWVEADLCSACVAPAKKHGRPRKAKPAPVAPATSPRELADARRARIIETLTGREDFVRPSELAREMGLTASMVGADLRAFVEQGVVESNGRGGPFNGYRLKQGRQTGAKPKARKPAKGADEEEGPGVEPPKPDPEPAPEPKPARLLGPIRKPEPEPMKLSICAPASPVPAQPSAPLAPVALRLDEVGHRAYAEIAAREPVRWGDVVQVLGIGCRHGRRGDVLVALLKRGAVHARGLGADSIVAVHPELLPPANDSGVFRLPMFLEGPGERRDDCANYDGCLDRFDRAHRHAHAAHCPKCCASFTPTPAHVRHAIAMTGGESALARAAESK